LVEVVVKKYWTVPSRGTLSVPSLRRVLLVLLVLAGFVGLTLLAQAHVMPPIRQAVGAMGVWAPLGIMLLRGVSIVLPALPSTAYSLLAGALLGFKAGFLTIAVTDVVACSFAFGLARHWGRGPVRRLVGEKAMSVVERFSSSRLESNFLLMTGLLMTGVFDFVSYGLGLAGTSPQRFFPALVLSVVVSDLPIVALGAGVFDSGKATLVAAVVGVFLLAFIQRTVRRRFATLKQTKD
jgi:uncharacterized membrane protein YdjX (TVP38/TMEM64 family)